MPLLDLPQFNYGEENKSLVDKLNEVTRQLEYGINKEKSNTLVNFNNRNDRDSASIVLPTIATDGTAIDHTINTDGSADISFEWAWVGANKDIDGWIVYVYQGSTSTAYNFGDSLSGETAYETPGEKRAFILFGAPANKYYTFGIQAYRKVDPDVNANGFIVSAIVKPLLAAENPYQPTANVAFAGNVTGTINGNPANTIETLSGAQAKANTAETNANNYTNTQLVSYVSAVTHTSDINSLQSQVDGNVTTWFYSGVPTLSNAPASSWTTTTIRDNHLGDLYYDTATGYAHRFAYSASVYQWLRITDTDVTTALANAATAQDTADGKRRVFVATPTPPYDVGDLWSGGSGGDLKRCGTAKAQGGVYSSADWVLATKYTDDTAANAAQVSADLANSKLTDLSNDNKLTAVEKQEVKREWDVIVAEKLTIEAQADVYGITTEKTNYTNAYNTLNAYVSPLLTDLTTTSDIVGTTFRTNFKDYYDKKVLLLKAISDKAKTLADAAQTAANNAQTAANNAQTSANTANATLADIASDSKLTPVEKQTTKTQWDAIIAEKTVLDNQATAYGVTTEKTTYDNAYDALNTYITPLLVDLTTTSDITSTTFRTKFSDYYTSKVNLLNKVADVTKGIADTVSSGTLKYRTNGAPTNSPHITSLEVVTNSNGTVNIKLSWGTYVQGTNQADMLLLFWKKGTAPLGKPTVTDACIAFNVNTTGTSYYIFEGVNPADNYSFGIAAARRTENGLEVGAIASTDGITATFDRPSVAYLSDGTQVASGVPRFEAGGIMIEEVTTNIAQNTSLENDLAGWVGAYRCTIARDTTVKKYGVASCKITTNSVNGANYYTIVAGQAVGSQITSGFTPGQQATFSVWLYADTGQSVETYLELVFWDNVETLLNNPWSPTTFTADGTWKRLEFTYTIPANTSKIELRLRGHSINVGTNQVLYADGVQFEQKAYATSFIDGTRATETLTIPTAGVLSAVEGDLEILVKPLPGYTPSTGNYHDLLDCIVAGSGATNRFLILRKLDNGNHQLSIRNGSIYSQVQFTLPTDRFSRIGWSWKNGGNFNILVDGVSKLTGAYTTGDLSFDTIRLGAILGGQMIFSDICISNIARSDAEMQSRGVLTPLPVDGYATAKLNLNGTLTSLDWQDITSGTPNYTGNINGATAATVVSNATNGNTAYNGTIKYRTAGMPTNNPTPSGVTITQNANATINIRLDWAVYVQGTNQSDMIMLFWRKGAGLPLSTDSCIAFNVNASGASYYIFEGVNPADTYSFGIAAARRTENGLEVGVIQSPISAPNWQGVTSGTPNYTGNINGTTAATVTTVVSNFNIRNDRKSTVPAAPTILADGSAIDHTINTDGSADMSFEWGFTGTGDAYDIDGFIVYVYASTSSVAYAFGDNPAEEQMYYMSSEKRAFVIHGVAANKYYTLGVRAYRAVDQDINSSGILQSGITKPSLAAENPYQPSSSVAFAGNITGTVNGVAASTVTSAVNNFNTRNDRISTVPANPTIASDGTAIDHTINTDGSADISFEWAHTGTGDAYDIDGFLVYVRLSATNEDYVFGTTPSEEQINEIIVDRRVLFLYGVPANKYYTIGVQAFRRVDQDINSTGIIKSSIIKSTGTGEHPYQPSTNVAFAGNVIGTVGGVAANSINKSSATAIIGADGSTSSINRADYIVPSGSTSAEDTINQAINALPGTTHDRKGKIVILEGTYIVDGDIICPSNIEIEMLNGAKVKIKDGLNANIYVFRNSDQTNGNTNIKIVGGEIDGNKTGNSSGTQFGIFFTKVTFSKILNILVNQCRGVGIYLYANSDKNFIQGNTCQYNGDNGIKLYSACVENDISNNKCYYNAINGIGLDVSTSINNQIINNTCNNNSQNGIYTQGVSSKIANNTCNLNTLNGVRIGNNGGNCIVNSNHCQENGRRGVEVYVASNNVVTNNYCIANGQSATNSYDNIWIASSSYNLIQGNQCRKGSLANVPRYGIRIDDTGCTGNQVTNNDLYLGGGTASFSDAGTGTVTIAGNRL